MRLPIIYGVIFGLLSSFFKFSDLENNFIDTLPFIFLFLSIVIATIHYKNKHSNIQQFTYKQVVRLGVVVVFVASIVISVSTYYYCAFQNPEFISNEIEDAKIELMKTTTDLKVIDSKLMQLKEANTIGRYVFNVFTANLVVGMFLSFILSVFLRGNLRLIK